MLKRTYYTKSGFALPKANFLRSMPLCTSICRCQFLSEEKRRKKRKRKTKFDNSVFIETGKRDLSNFCCRRRILLQKICCQMIDRDDDDKSQNANKNATEKKVMRLIIFEWFNFERSNFDQSNFKRSDCEWTNFQQSNI